MQNNKIQQYENVLQAVQKEDSLIPSFLGMKDKLFIFSPDNIQNWEDDKKEHFVRKTMIKIAHDENLKPCFESNEGKMSLVDAVQRSCSTGLEIGGKHAYLIPQPKKVKQNGQDTWITEARFSIKASGYFALLCGGDRPIFKDLRWGLVYEEDAKLNEKINDIAIKNGQPYKSIVDPVTGEIFHKVPAVENRGKVIGCWVQIVKMSGQKEAVYFTMAKVDQWKASSKTGNSSNSPWVKWKDEMTEQACIRHACDKYEQAMDLLQAAIYDNKVDDSTEKTNTDLIDDELMSDDLLNEDVEGSEEFKD